MIRYGLFSFGSFDYAVPLPRLRRILHQHSGYRLPRLPAAVAETLVDDGRLVPLLKLPVLADADNLSVRTVEYKVLTESEAGTVALPAVQTCGIVAEKKGIKAAPDEKQISGVAGIFKYQGKEYKILDIDLLAIGMTQEV